MQSPTTPSRPRRTPFALNAIILAALLWYPAAAGAASADPAASMWSFSAFGTVGAVHSSEAEADFATSVLKPSGAGHTDPWSTNVDSKFGAQVTANFTSQLSAVLQVI